jgi:GTPase SAR1 family protein
MIEKRKMNSVMRSKVVVVGDWAVGKTALVQQIVSAGTGFPKVRTIEYRKG